MKLFILGAGGHGKVVADTAEASGSWRSVEFFDDNYPKLSEIGAWKVVGSFEDLKQRIEECDGVIVAIGNNEMRARLSAELLDLGGPLTTLIHPNAAVSKYARVEKGCVIFAGAVVNAFAILSEGVIVNTGATIDHDCVIGRASHICPGVNLAGNVTVGRESWIGLGANVIQNLTIGNHVVVGAGATVIENVSDKLTVVGTPAKDIKRN